MIVTNTNSGEYGVVDTNNRTENRQNNHVDMLCT